ncbi:MAG TPA: hypothetical protein VJB93_01895 [Patescibacteria group bacterium]|nr:hypothetical protein [Patescibacteria group bacterium]
MKTLHRIKKFFFKKKVKKTVKNIGRIVGEALKDVFASTGDSAQDMTDIAKNATQQSIRSLRDAGVGIVEGGKEIIKQTILQSARTADDVASVSRTTVREIITHAQEAGDDISAVALELVEGVKIAAKRSGADIKKSTDSAKEEILEAVRSVGEEAVDDVKKAFAGKKIQKSSPNVSDKEE